MIKQQYLQLLKKRKRYVVTVIVLFLSFFVLAMLLNAGYVFAVKSFMARLPVPTNNRVELYLDWKTEQFDSKHLITRKQLKQKIQNLPGVQATDYVINNIVDWSLHTSIEKCSDNSYLYYCGEEFHKVFDFKLEEGSWLSDAPIVGKSIPVVLTRAHANLLGIEKVSDRTVFTSVYGRGHYQDSVQYQVRGIIGDEIVLHTRDDLERSLHAMFTTARVFENRFKMWSKDERLILKMKEGYDFDTLNQHVLSITNELERSNVLFQHSLNPLDELVNRQIKDHFSDMKLLYGILFILLGYIFVTLFGSFWKIANRRIHEAGIRRALGHTRVQVIWYLLLEPLVLLLSILVLCTVIYLNTYAILGIKYPLPIWLITVTFLFLVVIIATWLPAVTAGKVQPVEVLGNE
jgi:hypothetical protein